MREAIPAIAAAAIVALIVGAAGTYFLFMGQSAPEHPAENSASRLPIRDNAGPLIASQNAPQCGAPDDRGRELSDALKLANERADALKAEQDTLRAERDGLRSEKSGLENRIKELEAEVAGLKSAAERGPSSMRIEFGAWDEVDGLRKAEWTELGGTYTKMNELLKEYVKAQREGREPDPELQASMTKLNKRLQDHLVSFFNKLPSNTGPNGQFTHPINMVNILAGQLDAAGLPLTEQQIADLVKLGEEYERRWEALNKGYTEQTWELQKFLDECELKEWFHDEMFKVTDAKQKAAALPPEVEGLISMDLYSSGLSLMFVTTPVQAADVTELKARLKAMVQERTGLSVTALDGAEYIFDDWITAVQPLLTPMSQAETELRGSRDAIHAGKAELVALRALYDNVAADDEARKRVRAVAAILLPQIVKPE